MNEDCDLIIGGSGAIGTRLIQRIEAEPKTVPLIYTYHRSQIKANAPSNNVKTPFALDCNKAGAAERLFNELQARQSKPKNIVFTCFVHDLNNTDYLDIVNAQFNFIAKILNAIEMDAEVFSFCRNLVFVVPMSINKDLTTSSGYFVLFKMLRQLVLNSIFKLGKKGILCNFVSIGLLDEGFGVKLGEKEKKEYLKYCSLKRLGKVDEVIGPIHWLIRENSLIQGQVITIDGGL